MGDMEILAFILLILFIGMAIVVNVFVRSGRRSERSRLYVLPGAGFQEHGDPVREDLEKMLSHLEAALDETYVEQVKERVIRKYRITVTEWENRWFEWKRYLLMTAVLPYVSMYSDEVDEVWHEMLMYTREYEQFSRKWLSKMLHHIPHKPGTKGSPQPRAWFDVVYVMLFRPTRYSDMAWRPFLYHRLPKQWVNDFRTLPEQELVKKYFNTHAMENVPGAAGVIGWIVRTLKEWLREIGKHVAAQGNDVSSFRSNRSLWNVPHPSLWMVKGILFLSAWHSDHFFDEKHRELLGKDSRSDFFRDFALSEPEIGLLAPEGTTEASSSGGGGD
jgi:hypothetical protein